MTNLNICWIILLNFFPQNSTETARKKIIRSLPDRLNVCLEVANKAQILNIDPALATAIAYHESRFSYPTSTKGAKGPMQVITKYHCPKNKKCDLVNAGLNALKKFQNINKNLCATLAQYNRGLKGKCKKGRSEYQYAQKIIRMMNDINLTVVCKEKQKGC